MLVGSQVALQFELKDSCLTDGGNDEPATTTTTTSHAETQSSPDDMERRRSEHTRLNTYIHCAAPCFVYTAGLVQVILMLGASLRRRVSTK